MGRLLRRFWIPFARSERVASGAAPAKVRLLGENFVAFRLADGSVGVMDEACPHRCASLQLARNEGDGLRRTSMAGSSARKAAVRSAERTAREARSVIRRVGAQGHPTREPAACCGCCWTAKPRLHSPSSSSPACPPRMSTSVPPSSAVTGGRPSSPRSTPPTSASCTATRCCARCRRPRSTTPLSG